MSASSFGDYYSQAYIKQVYISDWSYYSGTILIKLHRISHAHCQATGKINTVQNSLKTIQD